MGWVNHLTNIVEKNHLRCIKLRQSRRKISRGVCGAEFSGIKIGGCPYYFFGLYRLHNASWISVILQEPSLVLVLSLPPLLAVTFHIGA